MAKVVGLRTEILVTLTFLLVAALMLCGLLMLRLTEQRLLGERLRHLDELVQIVVIAAQDVSLNNSQFAAGPLQQTLNRLTETGSCDGWWLYDQHLELLESFTMAGSEPFPPARRQQVRVTGSTERRINFPSLLKLFHDTDAGAHWVAPLQQNNRFSGVIELHFNLDDIRLQLLDALQLLLVYVGLYGLVLIAAGYYLLQRNIIRPASLLLRATHDVVRGELETRLPTTGPTEIAELATAYNQMVSALKSSRSETQTHIADLRHTNQQLQQARDELIRSGKMASVGQLAAGLAHELGNPLAALIGYLEVLKQRLTVPAEKDIAERSLAETQRIDYLVRELLNFSKPADKSAVDLVAPVTELRACRDLLANHGSFGRVRILDRLPEALQMARINRQKLHQVFINLLLNGVHACGEQGGIELSAATENNSIRLQIKDDGCGIGAADLERIFDPFYTTKAPGEGTGLGLSICHRIIEEAGGRLQVESELGQGSCFTVVLPVADAD